MHRLAWVAALTLLVQAHGSDFASWWTSREAARWNAQVGIGAAIVPFERTWTTSGSSNGENLGESGLMGAIAYRGAVGWTHPSGLWGLDGDLLFGTKFTMFEPESTSGSLTSGAFLLRWDPFCRYQIAPVLGAGILAWHARQHVVIGPSGWLFDSGERWASIDQERFALALGLRTGLRLGWLELQSDLSWPFVSSETRSSRILDGNGEGAFSPNTWDHGMTTGFALRIPLHGSDPGAWGKRRDELARARDSAATPHAWSAGYERSQLPPAWVWHSAFDQPAGGSRNGARIRWALASTTRPDLGLLVDLHEALLTGQGDDGVGSQSSMDYGADVGVWWDPKVWDALPLRGSATLGIWKAAADASAFAHRDSTLLAADWWGVRAGLGARAEYSFLYVGGSVDLDLVRPGRLELSAGVPRPSRASPIAFGGAFEAGFLCRF